MNPLTEILLLTLQVSGLALGISAPLGIALGAALALKRFAGRRLAIALVYTGMGFPPVVIGLAVYLLLSRGGARAWLSLDWLPALFTPAAMVLAQVVIALPLVAGFTLSAVGGVDPDLRRQVLALGATPAQAAWTALVEARAGVVTAVIAGFGGIISEVGAVMLVGGNIDGRTRVMTTAIVLATRQGEFSLALVLGGTLLAITFVINLAMMVLQGRRLDD